MRAAEPWGDWIEFPASVPSATSTSKYILQNIFKKHSLTKKSSGAFGIFAQLVGDVVLLQSPPLVLALGGIGLSTIKSFVSQEIMHFILEV